jgi:hypothetical protein
MAGFGGLQRDFDGLPVTHFADQNDLGGLAESGAQGQCEAGRIAVQLTLVDRALFVGVQELDWILGS